MKKFIVQINSKVLNELKNKGYDFKDNAIEYKYGICFGDDKILTTNKESTLWSFRRFEKYNKFTTRRTKKIMPKVDKVMYYAKIFAEDSKFSFKNMMDDIIENKVLKRRFFHDKGYCNIKLMLYALHDLDLIELRDGEVVANMDEIERIKKIINSI